MGKAQRKFGARSDRSFRTLRGGARDSGRPMRNTTYTSPNSNPSSATTPLYVKQTGGIFTGPIGYVSDALSISSGLLDLTQNAASVPIKTRGVIYVDTESGTTDTLDLITVGGEEMYNQVLYVIGVAGNTITVTHNSGSAAGNNRPIS